MARAARIDASGVHHENDPLLLVLMSLADGPKHGHALISDIERFASVRLGPGTLYGAITRLEREELIEPLAPEERRRPYRLTDAGVDSLRRLVERLGELVGVGQARLEALVAPDRIEEQAV